MALLVVALGSMRLEAAVGAVAAAGIVPVGMSLPRAVDIRKLELKGAGKDLSAYPEEA